MLLVTTFCSAPQLVAASWDVEAVLVVLADQVHGVVALVERLSHCHCEVPVAGRRWASVQTGSQNQQRSIQSVDHEDIRQSCPSAAIHLDYTRVEAVAKA